MQTDSAEWDIKEVQTEPAVLEINEVQTESAVLESKEVQTDRMYTLNPDVVAEALYHKIRRQGMKQAFQVWEYERSGQKLERVRLVGALRRAETFNLRRRWSDLKLRCSEAKQEVWRKAKMERRLQYHRMRGCVKKWVRTIDSRNFLMMKYQLICHSNKKRA
eukprot:2643608-Rhodomonas_salina.1